MSSLLLQVELELLDLRFVDDFVGLLALQPFFHLENDLVPLVRSFTRLPYLLLQLGFPLLELVDFLFLHHYLAVCLHHFLLFLFQLLSCLFLFVLDLADQLVELRLGHVRQLGVEVGTEEVVNRVGLLERTV